MPAAKCVRAAAVKRDEVSKGVVVHLGAKLLAVQGRSGDSVALHLRMPTGEQKIDGSDILVAAGRIPNTVGIGLELDPAALSQSMTGFEGPVLSESG